MNHIYIRAHVFVFCFNKRSFSPSARMSPSRFPAMPQAYSCIVTVLPSVIYLTVKALKYFYTNHRERFFQFEVYKCLS